LQLIDYGLFAEETFAELGKKWKNCKTFLCKHFLPLKYVVTAHKIQVECSFIYTHWSNVDYSFLRTWIFAW